MAEEEKKYGEVEREFGELTTKLAHKAATSNSFAVQVVADETNYLGIYMGANGKWNVRCVNSIFELKPQTLSNVLNHYLMVTDKPYRDFDEVVQEDYLWHNWEASAKSLMEKMQVVITELV